MARLLAAAGVVFLLGMALAAPDAAAQNSVFQAPPAAETPAPPSGFTAWVAQKQANFYRLLLRATREFQSSPQAALWLVLASFLYGVFHAAGPGHGKAVLGSYMLASRAVAMRGIALSIVSSLAQGATAIIAVFVLVVILRSTGSQISDQVWTLERASFALLTVFGAWLVWKKIISPLLSRDKSGPPAQQNAHHHGDHHHDLECGCGHDHIPGAHRLAEPLSLGQAAALIGSIALRPCSGAIIVLVFALTQKMPFAGILAVVAMSLGTALTVSSIVLLVVFGRGTAARAFGADSKRTVLVHRVMEGTGAIAVLGFGALLLAGSFGPRPPLF
ncbi:MAG: nickel/cobalt transporter [Pseudomonadota bacterium]